tara:strand:+ start:70 stop:927 length:858 start_codon:yes stop_codon:yes gene_type:complete
MKILVLGSNGLLGRYFCQSYLKTDHKLSEYNRNLYPKSDFINSDSIIEIIKAEKPNVVLNCVAVTSFEKCERNYKFAYQVNAKTPFDISMHCQNKNIKFIHISTDHFFGGKGRIAHQEEDEINLVNNYAITKHEAEQLILKNKSSLVLRTSIIGRTKQNRTFLDWIIEAMKNDLKVSLYQDAFTSFIHCRQFSKIINKLLSVNASGLYNVGCSEVFSKAEFCLELANKMNYQLDYSLVKSDRQEINKSISCGLSSNKLMNKYSIKVPSLEEVVQECVLEQGSLRN